MVDWSKVKHFSPTEWRKDPTKVSSELVYAADEVRDIAGKYYPGVKFIIHVAWDDGGHSPKSYHYTGLAVDFHFSVPDNVTFPYSEQFALLSSMRVFGGIGFYPFWNHPGWHIDLRDRKPTLYWTRIHGKYIYTLPDVIKTIIDKDKELGYI